MEKMPKHIFRKKLKKMHDDFGLWYEAKGKAWPQQKKWLKKHIEENFSLTQEDTKNIFKAFDCVTSYFDDFHREYLSQGQLLNNLIEIAIYGLPEKDRTGW